MYIGFTTIIVVRIYYKGPSREWNLPGLDQPTHQPSDLGRPSEKVKIPATRTYGTHTWSRQPEDPLGPATRRKRSARHTRGLLIRMLPTGGAYFDSARATRLPSRTQRKLRGWSATWRAATCGL